MEFCPNCGIGINNREESLGFCSNCKTYWNPENDECELSFEEPDELPGLDLEERMSPCQEIAKQAKKVRDAQKAYYSFKDSNKDIKQKLLIESKQAEAVLDKMLKEYFES